ncbi:MAG: response regulator [Chloroflexi bacterium]|nr:response regulator [Chloroflexota bacterium]
MATATHAVVADDDAAICHLVSVILMRAGIESSVARDGEEAWDLIVRQPPDLVITDLLMPALNGFELIERIREHYPVLPVIVLSALGEKYEINRALEAGATLYLVKPIKPADLIAALQQVGTLNGA